MKSSNKNPLAAFAVAPKIYFETQNPGEKIVLLLRRHFITNFGWIVITIILVILPLFWQQIREFLRLSTFNFQLADYGFSLHLLITIYYLLIFGLALINFLKWYFAIFLVTNKRVMDVDLVGFLYRNVSETQLEEIQDVSHTQGGLWQILFDYGGVYVQTAGIKQNIEILKVPHPGKVHDIITDLQEEADGRK
ncbi:MAG: PH domain-containing protein [Candidatus Cloacimonetes bacterium]|nr:PH domain-containing protein [Candidatus Cloacimonadota bacterium]